MVGVGEVHKSSGPEVHVYDFDTISINRSWEFVSIVRDEVWTIVSSAKQG